MTLVRKDWFFLPQVHSKKTTSFQEIIILTHLFFLGVLVESESGRSTTCHYTFKWEWPLLNLKHHHCSQLLNSTLLIKVKVHAKSNTLFKWDHCHDCYNSYSYGNGSCIELHPCDTSTSSSRTWFDMNIWRISAHQCCSEGEQPLSRQRRHFQECPPPLPARINFYLTTFQGKKIITGFRYIKNWFKIPRHTLAS